MRRRIEITAFERERIVSHGILTHCPICRAHSELLTPAQAAALAQTDVQSIRGWLAGGRMHGATTPDGDARICRNSLLAFGAV
jgi:hypothetical protein